MPIVKLRSSQQRSTGEVGLLKPITDGDGLRYPLEIGPLIWHVLGSGIYPVKGSDGLTHLAYELVFTNVWRFPATILIRWR